MTLDKLKHLNNGACPRCKQIFEAYPGFNKKLRSWFVLFQATNKEAHISCAGRGFEEQESKKSSGNSNASYGHSAHNWNAAIDLFCQIPGSDLYDEDWFKSVVGPAVPYFLNWYGAPGAAYPELPHIELREWRGLKATGELALVEPIPQQIA